jgi:hypothetical protein
LPKHQQAASPKVFYNFSSKQKPPCYICVFNNSLEKASYSLLYIDNNTNFVFVQHFLPKTFWQLKFYKKRKADIYNNGNVKNRKHP